MASDEAIKMAEQYAENKGNGIGDWFERKEDYLQGYTQGRADALKKLEDLKESDIGTGIEIVHGWHALLRDHTNLPGQFLHDQAVYLIQKLRAANNPPTEAKS